MLKLKTLARTSLGKVATRGMSGAPQKLECFIDGQKVGREGGREGERVERVERV